MTDFVFATCLPGVEPALKRELARTRPELRFAFSRPGLVTFRSPTPVTSSDAPGSVFARVWGVSLGRAATPTEAAALLEPYAPARVHVFARESGSEAMVPGASPDAGGVATGSVGSVGSVGAAGSIASVGTVGTLPTVGTVGAAGAVARPDPTGEVTFAAWQAIGPGGTAQIGELVADVVVAEGEPALVGLHVHDATRSPNAGGTFAVAMPPDSPSRAYAKIEEAIAWAQIPMRPGHVALEIGAAPGGAVYALARRGLDVWAVDPGALAPHVAALPGVHYLPIKVGALRWEQLPPRVDWLLCDMNLAPQVALHELARLMPRLRSTLRGAVITLKLNEWAFVDELPTLVQRIRDFGLPHVALRHLPSNRRELCAVALARPA